VHLLAHSMGNRALVRVLKSIASKGVSDSQCMKFNQIMLSAPDVDRDHFINLIQNTSNIFLRLTLYVSENDKALQLSKKIHRYPRAGDAGESIIILEKVDTIDASQLDTDFLGHSYFGDHKSIVSDIFNLLHYNLPSDKRFGLFQIKIDKGTYWEFKLGM